MTIWQRARDLAIALHRLAATLEERRLFRYAEQMRAAALSVPNNIAEGSGAAHKAEFQQFLNYARRSIFENMSMLLVFEADGLWEKGAVDHLLLQHDELSRMIIRFSRSL